MAKARYMLHVEHGEAIMGHFMVDDLGAGYNTKADSMLRTKRTGGPDTPKFLLTDETPKADGEPREELGRMITSNPDSREPR